MRTLCLLALLATLNAQASCPASLRVGMVDFDLGDLIRGAPKDEPRGILRDDAEKVLLALGCRIEWHRQPVRRLTAGLAQGQLDMVVGIPNYPDSTADAVYPRTVSGALDERLMLVSSRVSLFIRTKDAARIRWNGQSLSPEQLTVGIVTGTAQADMVRSRGWKLDEAPSFASNLLKLRQQHIDVALLPVMALSEGDLQQAPAIVELRPALKELALYAPFSSQFMTSQPKLARQIWIDLCVRRRLRDSAQECPGE